MNRMRTTPAPAPAFALATAMGVAITLAACSPPGAPTNAADQDGSTQGADHEVLTVVQPAPIESLNPNIASQRSSSRVSGQILEAATKIVYDGATPTIQPGLAESWEQVEPDRWRFRVRSGVTFTNGEELTSEAFQKSLEYFREDPAGKISGVFPNVEIEVVDEMTFDVVTDTDNLSALPTQMSWLAIVPPGYRGEMDEAGFGQAPVGTGPYKLKDWQPGVAITLEANPDYWGEAPGIPEFAVSTVEDPATRVSMLQTGEADIATDITPELADRVEQLEGVDMVYAPSDARTFLVLSTVTEPTENLDIRRAINHAIDRQSIVDGVYQGRATVQKGIFVPGELGYSEDFEGYDYDPEKARALIEGSGLPTPVSLDFNYSTGNALDERVAEVLQQQLEAVGFEVSMKGGPFAQVQKVWRDPGASSGTYTMSFSPIFPDSSFLLERAYFGPESVYNVWGTNDALTDVSARASAAAEPEERHDLYAEAQEVAIMDEAMWAPLVNTQMGYGVSDDLQWNPPPDARFYFELATWKD